MIGERWRRRGVMHHRRMPIIGIVSIAILAPLGAVLVATPAGAPSFIYIGNEQQTLQGTYLNAQKIADTLVSSNVIAQSSNEVAVVDPVDLSMSTLGTPHFSLSLIAGVCNIDDNMNLAAVGNLTLVCGTINLNGKITSDGTLIDPSRLITSQVTQINVEGNSASIQQAVDLAQASGATVTVSPGSYAENVTIDHPLTLSGVDGTAPAGADPTAPTINGTQPGGNVFTITSNGVTVDGLDLEGSVDGGASTPSVDGIYANGVDSLTLSHNTLDSFTGPGIETPGSTNVTLNANAIIPTAITSGTATTFTVGSAGTFTVTSTGTPASALSESGNLPNGVTFQDNGDGTATLAGTPAAGTGGTYPFTITTSNGISPDATQDFVLTVNAAPAFASANNTTFLDGMPGSFSVVATGNPAPTITESGTLPPWASFSGSVLSGTPTAPGTYSFSFTASNGVSPDVTQNFTLTVDSAPVFTSPNHATFTKGHAGSFTPAASSFPTPTITKTAGTLPSGVTFTGGKLKGTPTVGGTFHVTFAASNGVGTNATQTFTLTVNQAPVFTTAKTSTFTHGIKGTFHVAAVGPPTPGKITEVEKLPAGVTFTSTGGGVGTLTGKTSIKGTFTVTFKVTNSVGTASQTFKLVVK